MAFGQAAGRQQDDTLLYQELFTPSELTTYNATLDSLAPKAMQNNLTTVQDAVLSGAPLRKIEQLGVTPASWQKLTKTWLHAASTAGTDTATTVLTANASTGDRRQAAAMGGRARSARPASSSRCSSRSCSAGPSTGGSPCSAGPP